MKKQMQKPHFNENFVCDRWSITYQWKKIINYVRYCACLIVGPYEKRLKYIQTPCKTYSPDLIQKQNKSKTL